MRKYLVILGDQNTRRYDDMLYRLKSLGEVLHVLENVFLLAVDDESNPDAISSRAIRSYISGKEYSYCFVIYIDEDFSSAWSLSEVASDAVIEFIYGQRDENK